MKYRFLILLAVCTFDATAMVSLLRRAVTEEDDETIRFTVSTEQMTEQDSVVVLCDAITPCAWIIYYPATRKKQMIIMNSYCVCDKTTSSECWISEDGSASDWDEYKCMPPPEDRGSGN